MPEDKNPVTGRRTNPASDRSQNISGNSNPATEKRGSVAQNFQNPTSAQVPAAGNDQQRANMQDAQNDFASQFRDTANAPEKRRSYGDIARGMLGVRGSKADDSPSSLQQSINNLTDNQQQMMQSQQGSTSGQAGQSPSGQATEGPPSRNDQQRANMQDAQNDFASQFRDAANAPEKRRSYGDIARGMLGVGGSKADDSPSSLQQSINNLTNNQQQMMQSQQRSTSGQAGQSPSGQAGQGPPAGTDQQRANTQGALNDFAKEFEKAANAKPKTRSFGDIARGMLGVGGSKADDSPSSLQQSINNLTNNQQQMKQSQQPSPTAQNRGKIEDAVKKTGNPGDT